MSQIQAPLRSHSATPAAVEFVQPSDRLAATPASLAQEEAKAKEVAFRLLDSPCQVEHVCALDRLTVHQTSLQVAAVRECIGLSRQWCVSPGFSAPDYRIRSFFQSAKFRSLR